MCCIIHIFFCVYIYMHVCMNIYGNCNGMLQSREELVLFYQIYQVERDITECK